MYRRPNVYLSCFLGFTLIELMLVLGLLAVLGMLGQPIYQDYVERGHQLQAQADLLACAQRLQRLQRLSLYQYSYLGHADTDGDGLGDADAGPMAVAVCPYFDSQSSPYVFTIRAASDEFELTATPSAAAGIDHRGALSLDHFGVRRWDADNDGNFSDDELRWPLS